MNAAEAMTVRNWLQNAAMKCPRCGGAASGYSTWRLSEDLDFEAGEVLCDNCFFPRPQRLTPELTADPNCPE